MVLTATTFAVAVYLNPYAFHQVVVADYQEFRQPPGDDGRVIVRGHALDFDLPRPSLTTRSADEIRQLTDSAESSRQTAAMAAQIVRQAVEGSRDIMPSGFGVSAETLYRRGGQYHCLCSEYAALFNEVLQACGLGARIVWLEGHVANEYFDPQIGRWVYVDCHQNLIAGDADGRLLAISEIIQRIEDDLPVDFRALSAGTEIQPQDYEAADAGHTRWLRNVLLNGECYALTGDTLQSTSRWTQLLQNRTRPTMLVLQSAYDSSVASRYQTLSLRKTALSAAVLFVVWVLLRRGAAGRDQATAELDT